MCVCVSVCVCVCVCVCVSKYVCLKSMGGEVTKEWTQKRKKKRKKVSIGVNEVSFYHSWILSRSISITCLCRVTLTLVPFLKVAP